MKREERIPFSIAVLLLFIAASVSGCAAPQNQSWAPQPVEPQAILVEADGYSYLGDHDRLSDARERARHDALKKAVEQGTRIYIQLYAKEEFGVLKEDVVEKAVAGILTDVETLMDQLEGSRYHVRIRAKVYRTELGQILRRTTTPQVAAIPPPQKPISAVTVSFFNYTDVYIPRIYQVLASAPGVRDLRRLWSSDAALSYSLDYAGRLEPLEAWLREKLRTSVVVPFRISTDVGANQLNVYFDAGFE